MNAAKTGWREDALRTIVKQGAWAVLTLLILSFLGTEIHWFLRGTGLAVSAYVTQSGENIKALQQATTLLTTNLDHVQQQMAASSRILETANTQIGQCAKSLEGVQATHALQIRQSSDLLQLMEGAHEMMAPVSEQRKAAAQQQIEMHTTLKELLNEAKKKGSS